MVAPMNLEQRNLDELRNEIDQTDREILKQFARRMELVEQVAAYKMANNLPVYQPKREEALLDRVGELAGERLRIPAQMLFTALMDISKSSQHRAIGGEIAAMLERAAQNIAPLPEGARVACQGVKGAYSYAAAARLLPLPQRVCYERFDDVFAAVKSGECEYGVLPIENSSAGSVTQVYDLLTDGGLYIIKAYDLPITHCLMGVKGASLGGVKRVYSHPQALSQCSGFFATHREIEAVPCSNTAAAAKAVAEEGDMSAAALANEECAALYGLDILNTDVQNERNNITRFILLSSAPAAYEEADRIALIFRVAHRPGSLHRFISRFAALGLNVTKIESRPIPQKPFEFQFFFEFNGNTRSEEVRALLQSLSDESESFRFVGNYSVG